MTRADAIGAVCGLVLLVVGIASVDWRAGVIAAGALLLAFACWPKRRAGE